jgi:hypothetical protein
MLITWDRTCVMLTVMALLTAALLLPLSCTGGPESERKGSRTPRLRGDVPRVVS